MTTIQIKHRFTDAVLFEFEAADEQQQSGLALRHALEAATSSGADLRGADLSGAYLSGAYLSGTDLRGAYLSGTDLRGADLSGAYLRGANLRGADLSGTDLRGAYLRGADLSGACLSDSLKLIGKRPVLQIGPIGSRADTLLAFATDKGTYIRAGCFFGTRDEFAAAVAKTHGDNEHGQDYRDALAFVDAYAARRGTA